MSAPWSDCAEGIALRIRLTPRASRDAIDGTTDLADGRVALAARVRAVPEKGAANRALIALLAKRLSLPKSSLSLTGGATSRLKTIVIKADSDSAAAGLAALTRAQGTKRG